ncbi:MAG: 50S ribosomal protein L6 [Gammaproteobacteria bacterium]|jgi:large subunit ribosomal protein L6
MSRVAKAPIAIPKGVEVTLKGSDLSVKGPKGTANHAIHENVDVSQADAVLTCAARDDSAWAMAGTTRALIANMIKGVSDGFERKLELVGVGYRAQAQGKTLNLTLGFSHPINYPVPEGITIETPSQTEIVVKGVSKQQVGQVAAEIRAFRPPEPYKGKGVKYSDERVVRKEAKKK